MPAAAAGTKRKATTAATNASNKKAKLVQEGAAKVEEILADASSSDELRELAEYARLLEEEVASLKPKEKSAQDVAAEVGKLRASVRSGIVKQMGWKPSCKTGGARWVYDGVCADPVVFGKMIGLEGEPTFKMKKFSHEELGNKLGGLEAPIRYGTLYQKGDITVRWPGDATFKLSGTYGLL
ncbi:hypothetical protein D9611_002670 [Ephemerocybe angulata]|uniref:Uncharacterized protein n=1 Tax=Ephemerocybe angulata TaxID=980116 RepID=A0A8H5C223_9AGAR|nr:hypothetical protein D9611_002670 [Tulosesus angulatus]